MNFADYKAIKALNATAIKAGAKSMKAMRHCLTVDLPETKALRMGTALHTATLEPDQWTNVLTFQGTRRSNAYKALAAANPDALILPEDEHATIEVARLYLEGCEDVQELLDGTERELTLTWNDGEIGCECKCRIDAVRHDPATIIEFKSTRELGKGCGAFIRQAALKDYHLQLAFYARGHERVYGVVPLAKVLAVQLEPFCDHSIMPVHPMYLDAGWRECVRIGKEYLDCCKSDVWPGVGGAEFTVPSWAAGMDSLPEIEIDMEVEGMDNDDFISEYL